MASRRYATQSTLFSERVTYSCAGGKMAAIVVQPDAIETQTTPSTATAVRFAQRLLVASNF